MTRCASRRVTVICMQHANLASCIPVNLESGEVRLPLFCIPSLSSLMAFRSSLIKVTCTSIAAILTIGSVSAAEIFADVPHDHWARSFIDWAYNNHIMTGPGGQNAEFKPNAPATRAELAAVSNLLYDKVQGDTDVLSRRIYELERRVGVNAEQDHQAADDSSSAQSSSRPVRVQDVQTQDLVRQIGRGPVTFVGRFTGSDVVPPVSTNARGSVLLSWTSKGLYYDVGITALSSPIEGAEFRLGTPEKEGQLLESIEFNERMRSQGFWRDVDSAEWRALVENGVYLEIRTEKYPEGEVRAQVFFNR